jgi:hypothetical protein
MPGTGDGRVFQRLQVRRRRCLPRRIFTLHPFPDKPGYSHGEFRGAPLRQINGHIRMDPGALFLGQVSSFDYHNKFRYRNSDIYRQLLQEVLCSLVFQVMPCQFSS